MTFVKGSLFVYYVPETSYEGHHNQHQQQKSQHSSYRGPHHCGDVCVVVCGRVDIDEGGITLYCIACQ